MGDIPVPPVLFAIKSFSEKILSFFKSLAATRDF
jgi:hypothetical protein